MGASYQILDLGKWHVTKRCHQDPNGQSKSGNDLGYKFVGIVSNDPGAVGLSKPHTITKMVIEIVESIPNKDIIDKMGKGTNVNGVSTIKSIF